MKKIDFRVLKKKLIYFTPRKYKEVMRKQIIYAGLKQEFVTRFISFSILFSVSVGVIITFDLWLLGLGTLAFLVGIGCGILSFIILQTSVIFIADSRAEEIEKILPDALQLMGANIRAGMTIDRAIWLSARPEFGVFEDEIKRVGAKTVAGKPIEKALMEMTKRIKSDILEKTVKLIIEGIAAGGEIANLMEEIANNIRVTRSLKKEIKSSVVTYSIFILFAAVIGAPALFSIGLFFVETMTKLWTPEVLGGVEAGSGFAGGGFFSKATGPQVTPTQLFWFAIASLMVMTFFGSLIIGLIQSGKEKIGLKFIPLLMSGAIIVFFVVHFVISLIFGGFFLM